MAYPTIVSSSGVQSSGSTSPHSAAIPSPCSAGNKIVLIVAIPNSTSISTPTGFSEIYQASLVANHRFAVFKKTSDGTEGGTNVSFTGGTGTSHNAVYVLSHATGDVEVATNYNNLAVPNPPSITPTWSTDTLYVAFCSSPNSVMNPTAAPSGYSGYSELEHSSIDSAISYKTGSGTEDPGAFSASSATHMAATIAIKGAKNLNTLFIGTNI